MANKQGKDNVGFRIGGFGFALENEIPLQYHMVVDSTAVDPIL